MLLAILHDPVFHDRVEGGDHRGRRKRVAAEGGCVGTGLEGIHHPVLGDDGAHRKPVSEGLGEAHYIGLYGVLLIAEKLARPADARLDLIEDQEDVPFPRKSRSFFRYSLSATNTPPSDWIHSSMTAQVRSDAFFSIASRSLKGTKVKSSTRGS